MFVCFFNYLPFLKDSFFLITFICFATEFNFQFFRYFFSSLSLFHNDQVFFVDALQHFIQKTNFVQNTEVTETD